MSKYSVLLNGISREYCGRLDGKMESDAASIKALVDLVSRVPIGEIDVAVQHLQLLLRERRWLLKILEKVLACYNKSHLMPCTLHGSQRKVLTTYFNDMGDDVFCDPDGHQLFRLDHFSRATSEVTCWEPDIDTEVWRKLVDEACQAYVQKFYEDGVACVFGSKKENVVTLTVCISHRKAKKLKFWSGNWRSVWLLAIDPSKDVVDVRGYLRVEAHYYELGRTYMSHQKMFSFKMKRGVDCVIGKDFVERADQEEDNYLKDINAAYEEISDDVLKGFRRALPIWRTNMNWNVRAVKPPSPSALRSVM